MRGEMMLNKFELDADEIRLNLYDAEILRLYDLFIQGDDEAEITLHVEMWNQMYENKITKHDTLVLNTLQHYSINLESNCFFCDRRRRGLNITCDLCPLRIADMSCNVINYQSLWDQYQEQSKLTNPLTKYEAAFAIMTLNGTL